MKVKRGVEIITNSSRAARCALIVSTVRDLDQSAARNVALEGTEISREHAKFVAVSRAERSTGRTQ